MSIHVKRQGAPCSRGVALSVRSSGRTIYPVISAPVKGRDAATMPNATPAARQKAGR